MSGVVQLSDFLFVEVTVQYCMLIHSAVQYVAPDVSVLNVFRTPFMAFGIVAPRLHACMRCVL